MQQPPAGDELGQHGMQGGSQPVGTHEAAAQQGSLVGDLLEKQQQLAARQRAEQQRQEAAWQLQLDAPDWALFCLRRLPLQQLAAAAEQPVQVANPAPASPGEGEDDNEQLRSQAASGAERAHAHGAPTSTAAVAAAAAYISLLAWPGDPSCRQVLQEALGLQLEGVSLPAIQPWLEALLRWQRMLAGWYPSAS